MTEREAHFLRALVEVAGPPPTLAEIEQEIEAILAACDPEMRQWLETEMASWS